MSKRIEEIMQLSDNGYIEEYDDIEIILEYFLNYSMEELNNALPKNHKILDFAIDIKIMKSPVRTVCIGDAASTGAIIFLA